jgi:hypothetical protein
MKLICPSCGASHSLEAWSNDLMARKCLAAMAGLNSVCGQYIPDYLGMFRVPGADRAMSWKRVWTLLSEIEPLIRVDTIRMSGKPDRSAGPAIWAEALKTLLYQRKIELPLKNHNYLFSICWELADKADRKSETVRNRQERSGTWHGPDRQKTDDWGKIEVPDLDYMRKKRAEHLPKKAKEVIK